LFDGAVTTLAYHHGGTAVGSTSILVVFPEYRMVVSTMMNKGGTNADDLAAATDQIAEAFIDRADPSRVGPAE
jgi:serine beta-lactamase-like protein LACTB, mitochondrial